MIERKQKTNPALYYDKVLRDPIIKKFSEKLRNFPTVFKDRLYLTGGAIIDIIDGRKPKDFDFYTEDVDAFFKFMEYMRFEYMYSTEYSYTFKYSNMVIQLLKKRIDEFEFTVSQSKYDLSKDVLYLDELSVNRRILIPVSFTNKEQIMSALLRIPHWKRKGFDIPVQSYYALLRSLVDDDSLKNVNLQS